MKCIILAAGIGKRLRPLTSGTAKCLLPIGGVPLLGRTIGTLLSNSVTDITIVTGFMARTVMRFIKKQFPVQKLWIT